MTALPHFDNRAVGTSPRRARRAGAPSDRCRQRCFSITELLVVIGIIVLLVSLLLVALGNVQDKAKSVKSVSRMQSFIDACSAFQIEHGYYPGVVPEEILANDPLISGTENALLHLMGGFVRAEDVGGDFDNESLYPAPRPDECIGWTEISFTKSNGEAYRIKVNPSLMGEGPIIDGKPYAPYYAPGPNDLAAVDGQDKIGDCGTIDIQLPDLVDGWGQPIAYLRQIRTVGPLTDNPDDQPNRRPQFMIGGWIPYLYSTNLGSFAQDQTSETTGSILRERNPVVLPDKTLAQILRHPAFGPPDSPYDRQATARGAIYLFCAGADGIYFGRTDGPASPDDTNGADALIMDDIRLIEEFDDIVVTGGG